MGRAGEEWKEEKKKKKREENEQNDSQVNPANQRGVLFPPGSNRQDTPTIAVSLNTGQLRRRNGRGLAIWLRH